MAKKTYDLPTDSVEAAAHAEAARVAVEDAEVAVEKMHAKLAKLADEVAVNEKALKAATSVLADAQDRHKALVKHASSFPSASTTVTPSTATASAAAKQ